MILFFYAVTFVYRNCLFLAVYYFLVLMKICDECTFCIYFSTLQSQLILMLGKKPNNLCLLYYLQSLKADRESIKEKSTSCSNLPSPPPLNMESLTLLMERAAQPKQSSHPLTTLQSCLTSLKDEVQTLQSQLHSKTKELNSQQVFAYFIFENFFY